MREAITQFIHLLEHFLKQYKFRAQINTHLVDDKLQVYVLSCVVANVNN